MATEFWLIYRVTDDPGHSTVVLDLILDLKGLLSWKLCTIGETEIVSHPT